MEYTSGILAFFLWAQGLLEGYSLEQALNVYLPA